MQQLYAMSKEQLIEYAKQKGFKLDEDLTKDQMIERLHSVESQQEKQIEDANKKTTARYCKNTGAKSIKFQFQNMEDPGVNQPITISEGKEPAYRWELKHGEVYDLPIPVVKKMQALQIPDHKAESGPAPGTVKIIKNYRKRFVFVPAEYA